MPASATPRKKYDHLVKLLLIGDSGVGKSCLLLRFADDSFTAAYITTIGIDFKIKNTVVDGKKIKLQVWDTAGQERFRTITTAYYRGAMGILLVYDVSEEDSFANVTNWMSQIDENAGEGVKRVLVANKCDVPADERVISEEQGRGLAEQYGIPYFETSAKNNFNVEESFMQVTRDVLKDMVKEKGEGEKEGLKLGPEGGGGDGGCC
ncbi:hypothetical protein TrCOL_g10326 [Triparma columacea]|uniref:Uncharacterized protein n=1 Tax=Triparma columacea TaxID=722753 RepID=A0A9W7L6B5_9STRA|nr:hypothetical protein TrCOL_g10326 [Triparma columacea]